MFKIPPLPSIGILNSMEAEESMSDAVNPYQSPETAVVPEKPLTIQGTLTETMLVHLKGAAPWLRFVGILGFINSGLVALTSFSMIPFVSVMNRAWAEIPGFESLDGVLSVAFGAAFSGFMVVLFIGAGLLLFFPSLYIFRFGEKIRSYLKTGADGDLELEFQNIKSLWKFAGILCIIQLAFIPLLIIGGIIAALIAVFS
jgi:hypothetical protein